MWVMVLTVDNPLGTNSIGFEKGVEITGISKKNRDPTAWCEKHKKSKIIIPESAQ